MIRYLFFAAAAMSCCIGTAFGTEYVLDVTRLQAVYGKSDREVDEPESLTAKSIDIDIENGTSFRNELRSRYETITVKGRLTKSKEILHKLEICVEYCADEGRTKIHTSIPVVPEEAMVLGDFTSWGGRDRKIKLDLICICLDMRPTHEKMNALRRNAIELQYTKLVQKAKSAFDSDMRQEIPITVRRNDLPRVQKLRRPCPPLHLREVSTGKFDG